MASALWASEAEGGEPIPPPPPPSWDEGVDRIGLEVQAGAFVGVTRHGPEGAYEPLHGPSLSLGLRRRFDFRKREYDWVDILLAVPTAGLALLPESGFYGTELGFDVRVVASPGEERTRILVLTDPVFRVSSTGSRFRFPALLQFFAPAVGVAFDVEGGTEPARPAFCVAPHLFPFSVLFTEGAAIEIDVSGLLKVRFADGVASSGVAANMSFVLR